MAKTRIILKGIDLLKIKRATESNQKKIIDQVVMESLKYLQNRYDEITLPFDTDFNFEIVELSDWTYNVRPIRDVIERTTGTGGFVNSWILFNALDLGSENAKLVLLPDNFDNETFPTSLVTRRQDYNREEVLAFFNREGKDMEPRRWSALLITEYEEKFLRNGKLEKDISAALRNLTGLT